MRLFRTKNLTRYAAVGILSACLAGVQFAAALPRGPESAHTEQVKAALERFGANKRIGITLSDGEKLRGKIGVLGAQSFALIPDNNAASREIPYEQVSKIHPGAGKLLWISIGVIAAAVVIVIVALARTPSVHSPPT